MNKEAIGNRHLGRLVLGRAEMATWITRAVSCPGKPRETNLKGPAVHEVVGKVNSITTPNGNIAVLIRH